VGTPATINLDFYSRPLIQSRSAAKDVCSHTGSDGHPSLRRSIASAWKRLETLGLSATITAFDVIIVGDEAARMLQY
jgi:hypothetical protein